jgi:hypothetical protein
VADDPARTVPARDFLESCPERVQAQFLAVVKAVADAPPPTFSGGAYWEAMHGEMAGFYEVRVDGKSREHYRLFCILESKGAEADLGLGAPAVVLISGKQKRFRTKLSTTEYESVRQLGSEYRSRKPRSVLR